MAISCDPGSLATVSTCLTYFTSVEQSAIRVGLLCAYLNGTTVDCSPQNLAALAECILEKMDTGQIRAAETYLTCQVASNGGGGGSGSVYVGNFGGSAPPYTPSGNASGFDISTGAIWAYNGSAWSQFVA